MKAILKEMAFFITMSANIIHIKGTLLDSDGETVSEEVDGAITEFIFTRIVSEFRFPVLVRRVDASKMLLKLYLNGHQTATKTVSINPIHAVFGDTVHVTHTTTYSFIKDTEEDIWFGT